MNITRPTSKQPIPPHATKVFQGQIFDVYQWQQPMFDGSHVTFEKIKKTDTVGIIPITKDGKIILTKQEQPGVAPFIGTIGGRIDDNETPFEAAKRELKEEAGIIKDQLTLWYAEQFWEKTDWAIYMFFAYDCEAQINQELDNGEKIELVYFTYPQFIDAVAHENFRDWDVAIKVLRALTNPNESAKLKKLFSPPI